jgi:hypothetical protein
MPALMAVCEYLSPVLRTPAIELDALINPVVVAAIAVVVWFLARARGAGPRLSAAVAIGAVVATPLLPYTATSFVEPATALGVALALLGIQLAAHRPTLGGALVGVGIGLATLMRFDSLALVAPVVGIALLVAARARLRAAVACGAAAAPALAVVAAYNVLRYGSPLQTQYQNFPSDQAWSHPILSGVYGLVASPGRGLLIYAPATLLLVLFWRPVWRRSPALALACAALFADRVLVYAAWHGWHGGVNWGPRFLVPALPALAPFLLEALRWAATTLRRAGVARTAAVAVLGLIGVSIGVQVVGASTDPALGRLVAAIHEGETVRPADMTTAEWAVSAQGQAVWDAAMMDWSLAPVVEHTGQLARGKNLTSRFFVGGVNPVGLVAVGIGFALGLRWAFPRSGRRGAPPDPLPKNDPQRLDAVHPGDLLALGAGPGVVGDRYLERPDPPAQQLAGELGLHPEAVRADLEVPVQRRRHELVAGLQIRDVAVEDHVGEGRDGLVAHHVPERIGGVAAELPAAEDDVGPTGEHRVE